MRLPTCGVIALVLAFLLPGTASAQPFSVLTVDCMPFVSPGPSAGFGPTNTMGMALTSLAVNPGGANFAPVTEVTPAAFRAMAIAGTLGAFDLIAINNHLARLSNGCIPAGGGPLAGLGTVWPGVIGVLGGGRVVLTSHDAPRFHMIVPSGGGLFFGSYPPCPGCEPFGAPELIRDAAPWAGGGTGTGLLIFNESSGFGVGGSGWGNPELNLPPAWGIADISGGFGVLDGGYTDILPAFTAPLHPIYAAVNDTRLAPFSISSFAANVGDASYHSVFGPGFHPQFTPTEVVINSGVVDPDGSGCCSFTPVGAFLPLGALDGLAITLIRDELVPNTPPVASCVESVNPSGKNIPPAGSTTLPGSKGGKNDDGFYALFGQGDEDGTAPVFVSNASGSATFGPFPSGSVVKLTEAPGAAPSSKPMGGPNSAVAAHIRLDSDAFVFAVDAAGA